jgi:hypothetical protein
MINHLKNDCEDLNWIQHSNGTEELLNSCILDGDITMKLNDFNTACIILKNTVIMLKRKAGDEWDVAVDGTDPVQLKYSEEMTDTIIKYVLLDIQPKVLYKISRIEKKVGNVYYKIDCDRFPTKPSNK